MDSIKNTADVKRFFRYLYEKRNVTFHPDNKFEIYISPDDDVPSFTLLECERFNRLMDVCFEVCSTERMDIYELACEIRDNIVIA